MSDSQGNLFATPAPEVPEQAKLKHVTCGTFSVIVRADRNNEGWTEYYCEHCGWVIHPCHVEKVVEKGGQA